MSYIAHLFFGESREVPFRMSHIADKQLLEGAMYKRQIVGTPVSKTIQNVLHFPRSGFIINTVLTHRVDCRLSLLQAYNYMASISGKDLWKKLTLAFNAWFGVEADVCAKVAEIVTLLDNASLPIDDIEYDSPVRRAVPSAHRVFGLPSTLNTAHYVYSVLMKKCFQLGGSKTTQVRAITDSICH